MFENCTLNKSIKKTGRSEKGLTKKGMNKNRIIKRQKLNNI